MIDEKATEHIIWAADAEMRAAIEEHGEFHSHHEAWAVLQEEVQEVMECFAPFDGKTANAMDCLWDLVKYDAMDEEPEKLIGEIYEAAKELTKECVQVMAMCYKWKKLINKER